MVKIFMSILEQVSTSIMFVFPPSPTAAVELALSWCFAVKEHSCAIHVPRMNPEERAS